jgi:hypothetical protein
MEWLVVWIMAIMGGVVAILANSKGRRAGAWFLYGLLAWPIALIHIIVIKSDSR